MSGSYDGSMIDVSSDSFWEVGLALKFNSQDGKNIYLNCDLPLLVLRSATTRNRSNGWMMATVSVTS